MHYSSQMSRSKVNMNSDCPLAQMTDKRKINGNDLGSESSTVTYQTGSMTNCQEKENMSSLGDKTKVYFLVLIKKKSLIMVLVLFPVFSNSLSENPNFVEIKKIQK